ncbi:hypothetical protein [Clostridium perfringens]|uniref:hypothetical protein n=1 Tax=Clostridium perfringens TaxID=1502 RepID=UPI000F54A510|nr:hypothetical protein [Clostridium perfringens]MDM0592523.1 hypothetical protein [Clostridium perfringens]MDM0595523.1 hypothetical protein [Clostridium perfringens]MDU6896378.1 hypothetical protein [Clostridium perfringens]MDU6933546.1 hypothetical protein [Clostridium perfringens]
MGKLKNEQIHGEAIRIEEYIHSALNLDKIEGSKKFGGLITADTIEVEPYMMMFSCLLKIYNHENSKKIDEFLDSYSYCRSKSLKALNEDSYTDVKKFINDFKDILKL